MDSAEPWKDWADTARDVTTTRVPITKRETTCGPTEHATCRNRSTRRAERDAKRRASVRSQGYGRVVHANQVSLPPVAGLLALGRRGQAVSVQLRADEARWLRRKRIRTQQPQRLGIALEQFDEQRRKPLVIARL